MPVPIKSPDEIEAIARAGRVVWDVLERAIIACVPGVSTRELDALCEAELGRLGAEPILRGLRDAGGPPFPGVCCVNVNEQVAHAPPSDRVLDSGDAVSIDLAASVDGWCADACRSMVVGGAGDAQTARLVDATSDALDRGLKRCRPGQKWSSVAGAVLGGARLGGFRLVPGLAGHGIGRAMHEPPLCWLGSPGPDFLLRPGMVLTLEPILTPGSGQTRVADDGWAILAADGAIAAGQERTIAITRGAPRVLTGPDPAGGSGSGSEA